MLPKTTEVKMPYIRQIKKARLCFRNLEYDKALQILENIKNSMQNEHSLSEKDIYTISVETISILKDIEPTHARFIKQASANLDFVIYPGKINKACYDLINEIERIHPESQSEAVLHKVYYFYHRRDLEKALTFMDKKADIKNEYNFEYQMLKTRCLLLSDSLDEAKVSITKCLTLDPNNTIALKLHTQIFADEKVKLTKKIKSARWPGELISEKELLPIIRKDLLSHETIPKNILAPIDSVVAIGSCFAINIVNSLLKSGINAYAFPLGEEVNSTAANLLVLKTIFDKHEGNIVENDIEQIVSKDIANELLDRIKNAKGLIITLGVSQAFFDTDGKITFLSGVDGINRNILKTSVFKKISSEENVKNLQLIVELLRRINAKLKIVVTLSPVPLSRTFNSSSAIMDDCLSKCTLRVTASQVVDPRNNIYYWPSFEIAKWISPHIRYDSNKLHYGEDDNYSRHVSEFVVDMITNLFKEIAFKE